jgi:hypothetical protein
LSFSGGKYQAKEGVSLLLSIQQKNSRVGAIKYAKYCHIPPKAPHSALYQLAIDKNYSNHYPEANPKRFKPSEFIRTSNYSTTCNSAMKAPCQMIFTCRPPITRCAMATSGTIVQTIAGIIAVRA